MSSRPIVPSLQDFATVNNHVEKVTREQSLDTSSLGFMFLALDLILNLQEDEIRDSITDNSYLVKVSDQGGHDRGIDAVHIEDDQNPPKVHLFTFKYTGDETKTISHFPATEIDKIITFITSVITSNPALKLEVNPVLFQKVNDIWQLFRKTEPTFVVHVCSNFYNGFEPGEQRRFEREIGRFSHFSIRYHQMLDFVSFLQKKNKQTVNAKLCAIDRNYFEKSDGDIRALIVNVDARELLKIVVDDADLRKAIDLANYDALNDCQILKDAFEDNVRVYRERSPINQTIKQTALEDEAHRFFYYNNGITITCSHFEYAKQRRSPTIDLENFQVVNGSQTIHALFEAFKKNPDKFGDIDLLCRIYETRNLDLSLSIAEYTNSQNPVTSRDLHSNDYVQKNLETALLAYGYYYERKKGQHFTQPKDKRIDAEKAGQALFALFNEMPAEAKDAKRLIFADKYNEIFADSITADSILLATSLFQEIEVRKQQRNRELLSGGADYELESFVLHASYYILYLLGQLAKKYGIPLKYGSSAEIMKHYYEAVDFLREAVLNERSDSSRKIPYSHRMYFKSSEPKNDIEKKLAI